MSVHHICSVPVPSGGVFTSDLTLADQKEQLLKLIDDFADRYAKMEPGAKREVVFARLRALNQDLRFIQKLIQLSA